MEGIAKENLIPEWYRVFIINIKLINWELFYLLLH